MLPRPAEKIAEGRWLRSTPAHTAPPSAALAVCPGVLQSQRSSANLPTSPQLFHRAAYGLSHQNIPALPKRKKQITKKTSNRVDCRRGRPADCRLRRASDCSRPNSKLRNGGMLSSRLWRTRFPRPTSWTRRANSKRNLPYLLVRSKRNLPDHPRSCFCLLSSEQPGFAPVYECRRDLYGK